MAVDAVLTLQNGFYDFNIDENGDIETADFFDTAILVSLFADKRASAAQVPVAENRGGWIGNESTPGVQMGSLLWLFYQERVTRPLLRGIETECINALTWLVDVGYALDVEATASLSHETVSLELTIKRPNSEVDKRFYELWQNSGIR